MLVRWGALLHLLRTSTLPGGDGGYDYDIDGDGEVGEGRTIVIVVNNSDKHQILI